MLPVLQALPVVTATHMQVYVGKVALVNPIFWNLHIFQSHDVIVEGTYIWGDPRVPNNDGIDIDSSQNVTVRGVNVSTCDDAICIKTTDGRCPTCAVRSGAQQLSPQPSADT